MARKQVASSEDTSAEQLDLELPSTENEKEKGKGKEKGKENEAPPSGLAGVRKGIIHKPPRIFLYGVHGIGKSTLAAHAPKPIFICTEEGADEIDVDKFPQAKSSTDVLDALRTLYKEAHDYETVVLDSADWLEDFIALELAATYSAKELGYGHDAVLAEQRVADVLTALNFLREKRKMAVVIVAHCEIRRFDSPLTEPYDRYQPKLKRGFSALMQEWADCVLFATYDVSVAKEDVGFNKQVRRGISSGDRIIYTEERPAFYAKNRYNMPAELPLSFDQVQKFIPYYDQ